MEKIFSRKSFDNVTKKFEDASKFVHRTIKEFEDAAFKDFGSLRTSSHLEDSKIYTEIFYVVVDDSFKNETLWNDECVHMYTIPLELSRLTVRLVKAYLPISASQYCAQKLCVRFCCLTSQFDDYMWMDMDSLEDAQPPTYNGKVWLRLLPLIPDTLPECDYFYQSRQSDLKAPSHKKTKKNPDKSNASMFEVSSQSQTPIKETSDISFPKKEGYIQASVRKNHENGDGSSALLDALTLSEESKKQKSHSAKLQQLVSPTVSTIYRSPLPNQEHQQLEKRSQDRKPADTKIRSGAENKTRLSFFDAQDRFKEELDAWVFSDQSTGSYRDIRALLSTLHTVLWEGADWEPLSAGELMLSKTAIKKAYRKALFVTHPDKHQNTGPEMEYRSNRIFNGLNVAYKHQTN